MGRSVVTALTASLGGGVFVEGATQPGRALLHPVKRRAGKRGARSHYHTPKAANLSEVLCPGWTLEPPGKVEGCTHTQVSPIKSEFLVKELRICIFFLKPPR